MFDRLLAWYEGVKFRVQSWLDSWEPCYKESLGYKCHHRTYYDGSKECGR